MKTYQVLAARTRPKAATGSAGLPPTAHSFLSRWLDCSAFTPARNLPGRKGDMSSSSFSAEWHTHTRWPLQDKDLTEMLIKSEEDRNSQANGEGRKASEHAPLAKPSGYSCDKIRLPLNKSSNFPASSIVRQFRKTTKQNKIKPILKKRKKEVFQNAKFISVRDYT